MNNHFSGLSKIKVMLNYFSIIALIFLLSGCENSSPLKFNGYVEGQYIYITTLIPGTLKLFSVEKGMTVRKNQLLFTLESDTSSQNLAIAQAKVEAALEDLRKANDLYKMQKLNKDRNTILSSKDIISKEEWENSILNYEQAIQNKKIAQANLTSVKAQEQKEKWSIKQQKVLAPKTALVFDTFYTEGEYIPSGTPVMSLLDPSQIKIIFFAPQNILAKIKINQKIKVTYDGAPEPVDARISYISTKAEYTPPIIYSNEEKERLIFRIEASVELNAKNATVHPGQPVSISF
ncbi:hemolysin D [Legionella antarctica]|uniref:Hemolysin D n=1 Tax=Legionella antarctica TaxID=2708020 RepID=A0A6F8T6L3_9GAMM|nr:HlyD family efflux transporter periplasmic adaptor subunit [Legionella antarctica]BCA96048.1 hemolysin D [Legionella antarctica]